MCSRMSREELEDYFQELDRAYDELTRPPGLNIEKVTIWIEGEPIEIRQDDTYLLNGGLARLLQGY